MLCLTVNSRAEVMTVKVPPKSPDSARVPAAPAIPSPILQADASPTPACRPRQWFLWAVCRLWATPLAYNGG